MKKYIVVFMFMALVLSACRIESNILLDIDEDGSATVGAEIGFDEEMRALIEQAGGDVGDVLGELSNIAGEGVTPINRTEGDMQFFGATTSVSDLSTYTFDGIQVDTFSEFSYEFDENGATLTAKVDATGLGDLAGGELPIDPSQITAEVFSGNVLVNMPGNVVEHNADEVRADGTLVWSLPITGTTDIYAQTTFGGSGTSWIWLLAIAVVLLGGGAAVAAIVMSRKNEKETVAAAAAAHAAEQEAALLETEDSSVDEATTPDDLQIQPEPESGEADQPEDASSSEPDPDVNADDSDESSPDPTK